MHSDSGIDQLYKMLPALIGAFLSGCIDSSVLVIMITSYSTSPHQTILLGFKDKDYDESNYAALISKSLGTEHHQLLLTEEDLLESLPPALASMDQPTIDGINTFIISRAASNMGLKVALSGLGGDELFAGYHSFSFIPKLKKIETRWVDNNFNAVGRPEDYKN